MALERYFEDSSPARVLLLHHPSLDRGAEFVPCKRFDASSYFSSSTQQAHPPPSTPTPDLRALAPEERAAALRDAGLESEDQVESVETALAALPTLWVRAEVTDEAGEAADGDASVLAGEVLTLRVRLALTRAAHAVPGFDSDTIRGASSLVSVSWRRGEGGPQSWCSLVSGKGVEENERGSRASKG